MFTRFIRSNYNSVSRGQSAIIQEFQVIIRAQSGGMRAAGYSPCAAVVLVKLTSNPPIMSGSESGSNVSSSSSEGSDNERSTNRDLVIPSPVELSESEDDGVSPSQH
jgi:hypothetical protein